MQSASRRLALIIATICAILFPAVSLVGYENRKLEQTSNLALFPHSPLPIFTNYVVLVAALLGAALVVSLLAAVFSRSR